VFLSSEVIRITGEYRQGEKAYSALEEFVSIPATEETEETIVLEKNVNEQIKETSVTEETISETEPEIQWPSVDFEGLQALNPDVVGWIYIEGTNISYPIVQGKDNNYYLYRLLDKTQNPSGSIFLDADCNRDFSSRNNIIYGHNMKNGTMFYELMGYKEQEFYEEHKIGLLLTPEKRFVIEFFSGYVAPDPSDAWEMEFAEGEFVKWADKIAGRSRFDAGIQPEETDNIISMSTCTYEFEDARFVMYGILREQP